MKLKLILFFTLVILGELKSQTNFNFESWKTNTKYTDLVGWNTANSFVEFGANISCNKSISHWGNYGLAISPIYLGQDTLSGFAMQKFSCSQKPKSVSLYYHLQGIKKDSAEVIVIFYKGNTKDTNNVVGNAIVFLTYQKEWKYKVSDIIWKNSSIPDTAIITILSSKENDTLFIDDISFSLWGSSTDNVNLSNQSAYLNSKNYLQLSYQIPEERNPYDENCLLICRKTLQDNRLHL